MVVKWARVLVVAAAFLISAPAARAGGLYGGNTDAPAFASSRHSVWSGGRLQEVGSEAQPRVELDFPLQCQFGTECRTLFHVDLSGGALKPVDYMGKALTYEGHTGTDFWIPSWARYERGVDVLAAANGVVAGIVDTESDRTTPQLFQSGRDSKFSIAEKSNALVIDHGNGWRSLYAHLKKGSMLVKNGQRVRRGQKIARVGMSGSPLQHLHFEVQSLGAPICPFSGTATSVAPGDTSRSLWSKKALAALKYEPIEVVAPTFAENVGKFTDQILSDAIQEKLPTPKENSQSFNFIAIIYGTQKGDYAKIEIYPDEKKDRAAGYGYCGTRGMGICMLRAEKFLTRWPIDKKIVAGEEVVGRITLFHDDDTKFFEVEKRIKIGSAS